MFVGYGSYMQKCWKQWELVMSFLDACMLPCLMVPVCVHLEMFFHDGCMVSVCVYMVKVDLMKVCQVSFREP